MTNKAKIETAKGRAAKGQQGFTLVELAIVLVIIGLIIGGVLVGQDLIRAAEIRATAGQLEKYNTAVNTFRTKYNGLPGDLLNATAVGLTGTGNGDRLLRDANATPGKTEMNGEITWFWQQLSQANLVDGSYDGLQTGATKGGSFPIAKIDRQGVGVYATAGYNYYQIGANSASGLTAVYAGALTPLEANNIDQKIDDGKPGTGQAVARGGVVADAAADATATTGCVSNAALAPAVGGDTATYTTTATGVVCQIRARMQ